MKSEPSCWIKTLSKHPIVRPKYLKLNHAQFKIKSTSQS